MCQETRCQPHGADLLTRSSGSPWSVFGGCVLSLESEIRGPTRGETESRRAYEARLIEFGRLDENWAPVCRREANFHVRLSS